VNQIGGQVVGQSYGGYKRSGIGREVSLEGMIAGSIHTKQVNVRLGHGATPVARTGPCARMATRRRRLIPRDRW
jgi:aldehyde dehydrogenase (NAD+)